MTMLWPSLTTHMSCIQWMFELKSVLKERDRCAAVIALVNYQTVNHRSNV